MFRVSTLVLAAALWAADDGPDGLHIVALRAGPENGPRSLQNSAVVQPAEAEPASVQRASCQLASKVIWAFGCRAKSSSAWSIPARRCTKGQPLMRLDRTDYAHAITVQVGNVDAARARLQQAAADEARYGGLVSSGAVSQSAYDQVKAAADSARALLSAAEAQLKVAQDEGAYATLVADADGTVMETLAEPGQFVSAGQIVVRLARAGAREAAVNLPETLRPALGSTAYAILYGANADSATRYPARLRQLSDAADPLTRTFEARYVLEGEAARAPLGATVTVYLKDSERAGALSVPLGAIDDEGRGPGCMAARPPILVRFVPLG